MNRRRLLAVLGIGGAGAVGTVEYTGVVDVDGRLEAVLSDALNGESPEAEADNEPDDQTFESTTAALVDALPDATVPLPPTFEFDYEPTTFDDIRSAYFTRVSADPSESPPGDVLTFTPAAETTAEELATVLRDLWGVGESASYDVTTAGETVKIIGGQHSDMVALVGVVRRESESSRVLAVRARSMERAEAIADSFST